VPSPFDNTKHCQWQRQSLCLQQIASTIGPPLPRNELLLVRQYHWVQNAKFSDGWRASPSTTVLATARQELIPQNLEIRCSFILSQTSPPRVELETRQCTRQHFVNNFDLARSKTKCISVSLLMFSAGFGLYRNSYCSLMGVCVIIAAFTSTERALRANVLPMTLGLMEATLRMSPKPCSIWLTSMKTSLYR